MLLKDRCSAFYLFYSFAISPKERQSHAVWKDTHTHTQEVRHPVSLKHNINYVYLVNLVLIPPIRHSYPSPWPQTDGRSFRESGTHSSTHSLCLGRQHVPVQMRNFFWNTLIPGVGFCNASGSKLLSAKYHSSWFPQAHKGQTRILFVISMPPLM